MSPSQTPHPNTEQSPFFSFVRFCGKSAVLRFGMVMVSYGTTPPKVLCGKIWGTWREWTQRTEFLFLLEERRFVRGESRPWARACPGRCLCILLYGPATYQLCAKVLMAVDGFHRPLWVLPQRNIPRTTFICRKGFTSAAAKLVFHFSARQCKRFPSGEKWKPVLITSPLRRWISRVDLQAGHFNYDTNPSHAKPTPIQR